jgi:hypothetical protein
VVCVPALYCCVVTRILGMRSIPYSVLLVHSGLVDAMGYDLKFSRSSNGVVVANPATTDSVG